MKKRILQKKGIFIALLMMVCAFSVNAQTWTAPVPVGSTITNGAQFYVYSVGAKAFLDRGGEWDTQAIVTPSTGSLITTVANTTMWNLEYENSATKCLKYDNGSGWTFTDGNSTATSPWNVVETDAVNHVYSIQVPSGNANYVADQFLGTSSTLYSSNREGTVHDVRYNRTASSHTQWMFVTADELAKYNAKVSLDKYMSIAKYVGSSVDLTSYITTYNTGTTADINTAVTNLKAALTVVDKTTSILNADFSTNPTTVGNGWTGASSNGWSNGVFEYWHQNNKTVTQTISGLPAGVYVVTFQGYQRQVGLNTAQRTNYTNGSDALCGKMSVTGSGTTTFIPLRSIYSETTCPAGTTVDGLKFPNSTADAKAAFDAGLYKNELATVNVDGTGTITLTLNVYWTNNVAGDWHVIDNFHLYYYGAPAVPLVSASKASLAFSVDGGVLSDSLTVSGANLTDAISISAPAGITVNPTSLASNASNAKVYVTYDGTTTVSGNITFTSGSATTNVAVTGTPECFTPLYPTGNLVTNPRCTDLATYRNWGSTAIITGANAYCGSSVQTTGDCGGSIDYNLTGKLLPNTTYHLKAMMYTNGNGAAITLNGCGIDGSSADKFYEVNTGGTWQAVEIVFTTGTLGASQNFWYNSCGTIGGVAKTSTDTRMDNFEIYKIPAIYVAEASVPVMSASVGSSDSKTITVHGNGLTSGVSLALSGADAAQFSVSPSLLSLVGATDSVATTTVTITYAPTVESLSHAAVLTLSSPGATDKTFDLSASVVTGMRSTVGGASATVVGRTLKVKGSESYEVFTAQGLKVAQSRLSNETYSIALKPGVYIVKLDKGIVKVMVK